MHNYPSCVGCGYCCLSVMCLTAIHLNGGVQKRKCPYLLWVDDKYRCKLVIDGVADVYENTGCTSDLNSWRRNVKFRG